MSFWDHIKPSTRPPSGIAIDVENAGKDVLITWDDGKKTHVGARTLRLECPCAECVDEWTHERRVDPTKIPDSLTILQAGQVGNYALGFVFSDAHRTGIYNWSLLRTLSDKNPSGNQPA